MEPPWSHATVTVRYFAAARDRAGCDSETLPFVVEETVAQLRHRLAVLHPALAPVLQIARLARNDAFADDDEALGPDDEILVLPAASGGAPRAQLLERPIAIGEAEGLLATAGAGGIATFVGVVRRENLGRAVHRLEYSAYPPLALQEMEAICGEAIERFGLVDARVLHRLGRLEVGEIAVAIGVSAPHRKEAFAACAYVIDELKARVPIWKKEVTADGAEWLGSTP